MNANIYWSVYKNIESELIELSNMIHIDDKQLEVYSIKLVELLIRTVVEVESISKELYFQNGGMKVNDNNLFFDADCLDLLENKWLLSKKQVIVSAHNFYFDLPENKLLTPLKKANKKGTSSSDWLRAYQAVKHNRAQSLCKGNLKHLIRALAGLYVLNIYYKNNSYELGKDGTGTNFDQSLGSSLFSIKKHINQKVSVESVYNKNTDYDECVYLIKQTDETRQKVLNAIKTIEDKTKEKIIIELLSKLDKQSIGVPISSQKEIQLKEELEKIKNEKFEIIAKEQRHLLFTAFNELKYLAVLNKQQY